MRRRKHSRSQPLAAGAPPRAFTLVELLIVIAIIGVLLAILLPTLGAVRRAAREASTRALMRDVTAAIDTFRTQEGRLPGWFSPRDMGHSENEANGATEMENALLELAFSRIERTDNPSLPPPAPDNTIVEMGPRSEKARLDMNQTSASETAYLSLDAQRLRPVEGQVTTADRVEGDRLIGMADVIDDFGQPLLLWRRDQTAALPPTPVGTAGDKFAVERYEPGESDRASFYWASNAGYLRSGDTSAAPVQGTPTAPMGLGVDRVNQFDGSCIGGDNVGDVSDGTTEGAESLMGILGSPAFATEDLPGELPLPARARGDAVLISAGPDQVYFRRIRGSNGMPGELPRQRTVGYVPREAVKTGEDPYRTPEDFDDIIQASGG